MEFYTMEQFEIMGDAMDEVREWMEYEADMADCPYEEDMADPSEEDLAEMEAEYLRQRESDPWLVYLDRTLGVR